MSSIAELFDQAVRHHQSGQLGLAENLYRQVLQADTRHGDAWHLLGLIAWQVGRHEVAAQYISEALRLIPDFTAAHNNLGRILSEKGKFAEAEACYRQALNLQPDFAEGYYNLANVLRAVGRLDEAEAYCRQALRLQPKFPEALSDLGIVLCAQGKPEEAEGCFREALRLMPSYAEAHNNLGNILRDQGKPDQAEACFREALRLKPNIAEAHNNLGNVLRSQGKLEQAEACYREALRLKPDIGEAYNNLGNVLRDQGKLDAATDSYRQALSLHPDVSATHNNLGNVFRDQGRLEEAAACYRLALHLKADFAEAHGNLGNVLRDAGKLEEAEACCRQALHFKPQFAEAHCDLGVVLLDGGRLAEAEQSLRAALNHDSRLADAWYQLATLLRGRLPDADLDVMQQLRADPNVSPGNRADLCFGLAQVLDARREYDKAGEILVQANALMLDKWRRYGQVYDAVEHTKFVDQLLAVFNPSFFERLRGQGVDSERPVFIVGLPRSGTTLIEQILASHSQVFGAGELNLARDNFLRLAGTGKDDWHALDNVAGLDGATVRAMALWHLDRLRMLHEEARHVVDKMPDNYLLLGLLTALFPRAKFIHCRRDLRDVAVSCWMTSFRSLRWTSAFEHIAARFHDYERVMSHWRQVLPVPILEMKYEDIVADLEGAARRLVSWCGLDWEPACLNFHEGKRTVRTASAVQVRQPIFNHSVARWQHYERWLGPLFEMLPMEHGEPAR